MEKPPTSGMAAVVLNDELWFSEVALLSRDPSVGWDNISFV